MGNIQVSLNSGKGNGYFKLIAMCICDLSGSFLLRIRNIVDKNVDKIKIFISSSIRFSSNCAVYNIM